MNKYGYLINQNYEPTKSQVLWEFDRVEPDGSILSYIGVEGIDIVSNSDYSVIGNSDEFNAWKNQYSGDSLTLN